MNHTQRADELLRAAETGAGRCVAHGHTYEDTDNEPVVIEFANGDLEIMCLSCAEFYGHPIIKTLGDER